MTTLPNTTDVFVIGGGPAGLAAAIAARQRGLEVVLADGIAPPIDKACGEGIMPDGVAAAAQLGLDLGTARCRAFRGIRFTDRRSCVDASFPSGLALGLRRTELHAFMAGHAEASGVLLAWNTPVQGIQGDRVEGGGGYVRARWIIGADGSRSRVRRWAGLDAGRVDARRYGFRRHYRGVDCGEHMELHWGDDCQIYLTPVAEDETCAVLVSRDCGLRLDDALPRFPELADRFRCARTLDQERGGVTVSRRLKAVQRGNVALVGDASGSVDAVTGEGLCLAFRQAAALADAMVADDLSMYQREHRRILRRPTQMARMLLLLDRRRNLRGCVLKALASDPWLFGLMLAIHVGEFSSSDFLTAGLTLGWRMFSV